jgi:hypothetical protein
MLLQRYLKIHNPEEYKEPNLSAGADKRQIEKE